MPAVKSAGKIRIDQIDSPAKPGSAEYEEANFVAVSKPRPKRSPAGTCASSVDQPKRPRKMRPRTPAGRGSDRVLLEEAPRALNRLEGLVDLDEDENVGRGNSEEESAETLCRSCRPISLKRRSGPPARWL